MEESGSMQVYERNQPILVQRETFTAGFIVQNVEQEEVTSALGEEWGLGALPQKVLLSGCVKKR